MSSAEIVLPFEIGFDELMLGILHLIPEKGGLPPPLFVEAEGGPGVHLHTGLGGQVLYREGDSSHQGLRVSGGPEWHKTTLEWTLSKPLASTHLVRRIEHRTSGIFVIVSAKYSKVRRHHV